MKKGNYFSKPVIASSGVLGFFGEGYKHYRILNILTLGFFGYMLKNWIVFQSKTATAFPNKGNAKLDKDGFSLKEMHPKCVAFNFWRGWMVNNFSLSNPGLEALLDTGLLYKVTGELHLSISLVKETLEERLEEARHIVMLIEKNCYKFNASKIYLDVNGSCPNTGKKNAQDEFINTFFGGGYEILSKLKLPMIVKVGWKFPISVAKEMQYLEYIYGFSAINTIPFNELPDDVKVKYFKKDKQGNFISPLDKHQVSFNVKGRGGVSGNPIRPFALDWLVRAREGGIYKPICGGGGLMNPAHVKLFIESGATSISLGTCVTLRCFFLPFIILKARFF